MSKQSFTLPKNSTDNKILFINARIIDPASKYDKKGELFVENGKIKDFGSKKIFNGPTPKDVKVIDCKGNILAPGLIDIQVHFRDPGVTHKEDIHTGSKSAVAGGITSVVCQPNTSPVIDNVATLEYIHNKAKEVGFCNVFCYAAISKDMKGETLSEMASLVEAGAIGFTDDGLPVMNANLMRRALEYASNLNTVISQHAEDLDLSDGGCMNEGKTSERLGVKGIPNVSESVIVERDIALSELTNSKYHVLHVSTKEAAEAIRRAKAKGLKVTGEAAPHHFTLNDEALDGFNTNAKMNPPLRSEEDRRAIIAALKDGTLEAIATDHAPHDKASKDKPLASAAFGIVGLETMLPLALELHFKEKMPLINVLATMTNQAAKIINIDRGEIKKNAVADLVIFDLDKEWNIDINKFSSKSNNSPFHGRKVKGKVIQTILGGKIVYHDNI
jgi:dihydroorotase